MTLAAIYLKRTLIVLALVINMYCAVYILTDGAYCNHIRINSTNSLPFYVFSTSHLDSIERGDYVSLIHHLSYQDLFKQVVGLPGDKILINDQQAFVNGINCGHIYPLSPSGKSLSPISDGIIPEGFIYVHATHPESFDSRYAEFGLVALDQLKEKLWPIF